MRLGRNLRQRGPRNQKPSLLTQAMGILRLPGITAHLYLPNVSNYLLSDGSTGLTAVDGVAGLVLDGIGVKTQIAVPQDLTTWTSGGAFNNWSQSTATADTITAVGGFGSRYIRLAAAPGDMVIFSALVVAGTTPGMVSIVFGDSGLGYLQEYSATSIASGAIGIGRIAPAGTAYVELVIRAVDAGLTVGFSSLSAFFATGIPAKQPTTAAKPILKFTSGKYWWDFDGVDDALTRTFPAGYESSTVINAAPGGQVTLTGQNAVGAYPITADTYGQIIVKVSSSLTGGQLAVLQAYANSLAGV